MPELSILTPDGKVTPVKLTGPRMALGTVRNKRICHSPRTTVCHGSIWCFEQDAEGWQVLDVGSKNGTVVNGQRIECPTRLKPGDQILAGHLTMVFDAPGRKFERRLSCSTDAKRGHDRQPSPPT